MVFTTISQIFPCKIKETKWCVNARTCAKVSVLGVRDCWRILHTYQLDAVYDCCSRLGISSYWQDNIYSDWPWSICLLFCDNYVPQWWVEFNNMLSWLFTNRFSATRYMKVKRIFVCTKNGLFIHAELNQARFKF